MTFIVCDLVGQKSGLFWAAKSGMHNKFSGLPKVASMGYKRSTPLVRVDRMNGTAYVATLKRYLLPLLHRRKRIMQFQQVLAAHLLSLNNSVRR